MERVMGTTTEQAWEAFHAPLHQFIRRRVTDDATAEDLLQDVFLKIHQHGSSLKDVRRLESWIYQITRNFIIDYYRSHSQPLTSLGAEEVFELPEELPDDDIVSDLLPCVRAMVLALPEQDRQALILTEYQGLTQKELGERLGLSFSGAKSRVQRAREKLKQELLACCHFELDRRGHILDYQPRCDCCEQSACSEEGGQGTCKPMRPFLPDSVSSGKGKREGRGAFLVVFLTAILLSVQHFPTYAYLVVLATLGYGAALGGYGARRFRQQPMMRRVLGNQWIVAHIVGMIGSYVVLWTAFYVDNAHLIPGLKQLPTFTFWALPTMIALPFLVVSPSHFAPKTALPAKFESASNREERTR